MADNGFTVKVDERQDLAEINAEAGVPPALESCHTAIVDGYVVVGHVPAEDVRRLLSERPPVTGIAVPGMPIGSPGMEVAGADPQPFDVLTFDRVGETAVYSSH
jgi:hypothetical protein